MKYSMKLCVVSSPYATFGIMVPHGDGRSINIQALGADAGAYKCY